MDALSSLLLQHSQSRIISSVQQTHVIKQMSQYQLFQNETLIHEFEMITDSVEDEQEYVDEVFKSHNMKETEGVIMKYTKNNNGIWSLHTVWSPTTKIKI